MQKDPITEELSTPTNSTTVFSPELQSQLLAALKHATSGHTTLPSATEPTLMILATPVPSSKLALSLYPKLKHVLLSSFTSKPGSSVEGFLGELEKIQTTDRLLHNSD